MNENRFFELLAAYGADLRRWPEGEQEAAEDFLSTASHRVKDIWESERSFDGLLAVERDFPASVNLETRVLTSMPQIARASKRSSFSFGLRQRVAAGGAIAAALLVGVAAGYAAEPVKRSQADFGAMLSLSGSGANAVFLSAMNDTVRED